MLTLKDVADRYSEIACDLANAISKIADIRGTASFLTDECRDNGDPKFALDEALAKLAPALAEVVEYGREYAEEAKKYGASARAYDPSREG